MDTKNQPAVKLTRADLARAIATVAPMCWIVAAIFLALFVGETLIQAAQLALVSSLIGVIAGVTFYSLCGSDEWFFVIAMVSLCPLVEAPGNLGLLRCLQVASLWALSFCIIGLFFHAAERWKSRAAAASSPLWDAEIDGSKATIESEAY